MGHDAWEHWRAGSQMAATHGNNGGGRPNGGLIGQRIYHRTDSLSQCREVLGNDPPHELKIDPEILMDHDVAEGNDLGPRNLGVSFAKRGRQAPASFTQQRQAMQYCALNQEVAEKRVPALLAKPGNQFDLLDSIEKTEAVRPHNETASRITSDARRGLSPRLETTSTLQPNTPPTPSNQPVRSSRDRPGSKSTRKSISESWR